jgi:hypothetical protein
MRRSSSAAALLYAALALGACAELPPDSLSLPPQETADRELQGRRFEGLGEAELLAASVSVLQDLGFTVHATHTGLGFVRGSMQREAKAPEQMLILLIAAAMAGAAGAMPPPMPVSAETGKLPQLQQISVMLSVRPAAAGEAQKHIVLVSFHHRVRQPLWQSAGPLRDPQLYQSFFALLSKTLFLEAHQL